MLLQRPLQRWLQRRAKEAYAGTTAIVLPLEGLLLVLHACSTAHSTSSPPMAELFHHAADGHSRCSIARMSRMSTSARGTHINHSTQPFDTADSMH